MYYSVTVTHPRSKARATVPAVPTASSDTSILRLHCTIGMGAIGLDFDRKGKCLDPRWKASRPQEIGRDQYHMMLEFIRELPF